MKDETQYTLFSTWKDKNKQLLSKLQDHDTLIYFKFSHILAVVSHLYDQLIDNEHYGDDEDVIFITGFNYLDSMIEDLKQIVKAYFNNDLDSLIKHDKELCLVMDAIEFQNELLRFEEPRQADIKTFNDFEIKILEKIAGGQVLSPADYEELDSKSATIFQQYTNEYMPITSIFLKIADELELDY